MFKCQQYDTTCVNIVSIVLSQNLTTLILLNIQENAK